VIIVMAVIVIMAVFVSMAAVIIMAVIVVTVFVIVTVVVAGMPMRGRAMGIGHRSAGNISGSGLTGTAGAALAIGLICHRVGSPFQISLITIPDYA
jgi:hypothetical protein